jgi:hypothetical protein
LAEAEQQIDLSRCPTSAEWEYLYWTLFIVYSWRVGDSERIWFLCIWIILAWKSISLHQKHSMT